VTLFGPKFTKGYKDHKEFRFGLVFNSTAAIPQYYTMPKR